MSFEESAHAKTWIISREEYHQLRAKTNNRQLTDSEVWAMSRTESTLRPTDLLTDEIREVLRQEEEIFRVFTQKIRENFEGRKHHWRLPASAILFFRRFYLNNSLLVHDPRNIMLAAILLAGKVEESHVKFEELLELHDKATEQAIKKAELILLQGVNFNLLVFHPQNVAHTLIADFRSSLPHNDANTDSKAAISTSSVTAGEPLAGAALAEHTRQTHSTAGKKWAADAEAILKDLQLSIAGLCYSPTVIAISALRNSEPQEVFPQTFDRYLRIRFGEELSGEFLRLSSEVSDHLLPGTRTVVDKKYYRHVCMGRLKNDSIWMKKGAAGGLSSSSAGTAGSSSGSGAGTQSAAAGTSSSSSAAIGATAAVEISSSSLNIAAAVSAAAGSRGAEGAAKTAVLLVSMSAAGSEDGGPQLKKVKIEDSTS